jgi:hypothetical protein
MDLPEPGETGATHATPLVPPRQSPYRATQRPAALDRRYAVRYLVRSKVVLEGGKAPADPCIQGLDGQLAVGQAGPAHDLGEVLVEYGRGAGFEAAEPDVLSIVFCRLRRANSAS